MQVAGTREGERVDRKTTNRIISFLVDEQKVRDVQASADVLGRIPPVRSSSWRSGPCRKTPLLL